MSRFGSGQLFAPCSRPSALFYSVCSSVSCCIVWLKVQKNKMASSLRLLSIEIESVVRGYHVYKNIWDAVLPGNALTTIASTGCASLVLAFSFLVCILPTSNASLLQYHLSNRVPQNTYPVRSKHCQCRLHL